MKYGIHAAAENRVKPHDAMLIGEGGLIDADKVGGKNGLQIPESVLYPVVTGIGINGDYFAIDDGKALDLLERESAYFVIPVSDKAIRTGRISDKVFNLLRQRRGGVDYGDDFLFRFMIDDEPVFHIRKSSLHVDFSEETEYSGCGD